MTDADWLAAVAAAPDDPLVRLAYADWLDDRGDPRGDLLRLDVAVAGGTDPAAATRLAEVSAGVPLGWRAAVCRVPQACAAGDFYQLDMCMCDGPELATSEFFGRPGTGYHTLQRTPVGRAEVEQVCAAVRACERFTLRYGGRDPVVINLLSNREEFCDHTICAEDSPFTRYHPAPDPRGLAYVAAAYQGAAIGRRLRDTVAGGLNWLSLAILTGFGLLLLVIVVVRLVRAAIRD